MPKDAMKEILLVVIMPQESYMEK